MLITCTTEKEKQAEGKFKTLKMQVQLVRDFADQLSHYGVNNK